MNSNTCPQCDTENPSGARVCYQCKKILRIGAHTICDSCYHRNPLHLENCVNCGMQLEQPEIVAQIGDPEVGGRLDSAKLATGTGALPALPEEELSRYEYAKSNGTNVIDPSEEPTKKNKLPDLVATEFSDLHTNKESNKEFESGSDNITRKNPLPPAFLEDQDQTNHDQPSDQDVDLLSILDLDILDMEEDDLISDSAPRQLSVDQLTPTDWIRELDSHDDLPTMADMLPKLASEEPSEQAMPEKEHNNVMDMLFGDTGTLDQEEVGRPQTAKQPKLPGDVDLSDSTIDEFDSDGEERLDDGELVVEEPKLSESGVLKAEEGAIDNWLNDVITEFEQVEPEQNPELITNGIVDELPGWMDLGALGQLSEPREHESEHEEESERLNHADKLSAGNMTDEAALNEAGRVLDGAGYIDEANGELSIGQSDIIPHASTEVGGSEILGQDMNHGNEKSEKERVFSNESALDDDSLDWLTEDLDDELNHPPIVKNDQVEPNQTRNLSEIDLPADILDINSHGAGDEVTAVQVELPNWIKQMAPNTERESGITIEDNEEGSLIDDDQLSQIIANLESETISDVELDTPVSGESLELEASVSSTPAATLNEEVGQEPDLEQFLSSFGDDAGDDFGDDSLAGLDFSSPGMGSMGAKEQIDLTAGEDLLHAELPEPDAQIVNEVDEVDDETLIQDAILAIQTEIQEIRTGELSADPPEDRQDDLPDWLPNTDGTTSIKPTQTEDLPDWLQRPQTEPLDPSALGYIQGRIDEIKSMQDDVSEGQNPADEIEKIISDHTVNQDLVPPSNTAAIEEPKPEPAAEVIPPIDPIGDLAQFDWSDIEEDSFNTESEFVMKGSSQTQTGSLTEDALDILSEAVDEPATDSNVDSTPNTDESFDWLSDGADEFLTTEPESVQSSLSDHVLDTVADGSSDLLGLISDDDANLPDTDNLNAEVLGSSDLPAADDELDEFDELDELFSAPETINDAENSLELPAVETLDLLEQAPEMSDLGDLEDDFIDMHDLPTVSDLVDTVEEPDLDEMSGDLQINFEDESLELAAEIEAQAVPDEAVDPVSAFEFEDHMNAWDEMESAFEPLIEFDDENDVFSGVRDNPKIYETISAESLAAFQQKEPQELDETEPAANMGENPDEAVDFLNALSNTEEVSELPSWANELTEEKESEVVDDRVEISPLQGLEDIVDIAPTVAKPVADLKNLHAPQMMEPVAHRRKAHLAAQAAGSVPMSDPTQPVVVPKERQRYQPRFDANQFDGRPNHEKSKRSRQIGFLVVAAVLAIMVAIAFAVPWLISLVTGG